MSSHQGNLKIYNSLSGQKEKFEPIHSSFVGMYVCGPTLYSEPHMGNMRTFINFDMIFRYLLQLDYKVKYVRNITDAGHITNSAGDEVDSIGKAAKSEKMQSLEIVYKYNVKFQELQRIYNLLPPSIEPTATGHIQEQIEHIEKIIENGFAYVVNGSQVKWLTWDKRKVWRWGKSRHLAARFSSPSKAVLAVENTSLVWQYNYQVHRY